MREVRDIAKVGLKFFGRRDAVRPKDIGKAAHVIAGLIGTLKQTC